MKNNVKILLVLYFFCFINNKILFRATPFAMSLTNGRLIDEPKKEKTDVFLKNIPTENKNLTKDKIALVKNKQKIFK